MIGQIVLNGRRVDTGTAVDLRAVQASVNVSKEKCHHPGVLDGVPSVFTTGREAEDA